MGTLTILFLLLCGAVILMVLCALLLVGAAMMASIDEQARERGELAGYVNQDGGR